jgi:hypothetical protein
MQIPPDDRFAHWLRTRRQAGASIDLSDRIMQSVSAMTETVAVPLSGSGKSSLNVRSTSGWTKIAACIAAMMIGMIPFIYLFFLSLGTVL